MHQYWLCCGQLDAVDMQLGMWHAHIDQDEAAHTAAGADIIRNVTSGAVGAASCTQAAYGRAQYMHMDADLDLVDPSFCIFRMALRLIHLMPRMPLRAPSGPWYLSIHSYGVCSADRSHDIVSLIVIFEIY